MARIRSIRLEFFRSADVAMLSHRARLTWIGLWTIADDAGRLKDDPRLIKGDLWPLEDAVDIAAVEADLVELEFAGRITRYEVAGVRYIECVNFAKYQKPNRPTRSTIPGPDPSVNPHAPFTEGSPLEGRGVGVGGEGDRSVAEPSRYCPQHPSGTTRPCIACKDARLAWERWESTRQTLSGIRTVAEDPATCSHKTLDVGGYCALCGTQVREGVPSHELA